MSLCKLQAMVHELLGLNRNRVVLKGAPGVREDLTEVHLMCFASFNVINRPTIGCVVVNSRQFFRCSSAFKLWGPCWCYQRFARWLSATVKVKRKHQEY